MSLPALNYHHKVRDHFKQLPAIWAEFTADGAMAKRLVTPAAEWKENTAPLEPDSARELARIELFSLQEGELKVTGRILAAITSQYEEHASPSLSPYYRMARRWDLYTEIYCDRATAAVTGDDEESSLRARALRLWQKHPETAEASITELIEGAPPLGQLDIFAQKELATLTRELLQQYLSPAWFRTAPVRDLTRQYFSEDPLLDEVDSPGLATAGPPHPAQVDTAVPASMTTAITNAHSSVKEYFSYVLLDFALVDPSLQEVPAGRAFQFAGALQIAEPFASIVKKELQLSDKKLQQYQQQALSSYGAADLNLYPNPS